MTLLIMIPLSNHTHEYIVIKKEKHVAEIEIWNNEIEIFQMIVFPDIANVILQPI